MTGEEVAGALRIAPRQVEALENGEWDALPGVAFVRGALRAYGRLLGCDVAPLLEQVALPQTGQLRATSSLGVALRRESVIGFGGGGTGNRWVWVVLVVVGIVAVAMFFAGGQGLSGMRSWIAPAEAPSAEPASPAGTVTEPLPIPGTSAPPATPAESAAPPPSSTGPAVPDSALAPPPGAAVGMPAAPLPAAAQSAVPALRVEFERNSWVDIRDASGAQLLIGMQPAGSSVSLAGRSPFALVIGNAAHVRLERAGRAVTLVPAAPSGVARLTVE